MGVFPHFSVNYHTSQCTHGPKYQTGPSRLRTEEYLLPSLIMLRDLIGFARSLQGL